MENSNRLIRRPEVERRVGLKRTAIYDWIKCGKFPRPVRLSSTAVAWVEAEIDKWIEDRISEDRAVGE